MDQSTACSCADALGGEKTDRDCFLGESNTVHVFVGLSNECAACFFSSSRWTLELEAGRIRRGPSRSSLAREGGEGGRTGDVPAGGVAEPSWMRGCRLMGYLLFPWMVARISL